MPGGVEGFGPHLLAGLVVAAFLPSLDVLPVNEGLMLFMHRDHNSLTTCRCLRDAFGVRPARASSPRSGLVQQRAAGNGGVPVRFRPVRLATAVPELGSLGRIAHDYENS